jgi:hypothetical protein
MQKSAYLTSYVIAVYLNGTGTVPYRFLVSSHWYIFQLDNFNLYKNRPSRRTKFQVGKCTVTNWYNQLNLTCDLKAWTRDICSPDLVRHRCACFHHMTNHGERKISAGKVSSLLPYRYLLLWVSNYNMAIQVAFSLARLFNIFKMAHAQSIGSGKLPICPRSGSGFSESFLFRVGSESEPNV